MVTIASSGSLSLPEVPSLDFIGVGPDPDQTITNAPSPWELFNIARESVYLNDSVLPEISWVHASLRVSSLRLQTQP